MSFKLIISTFFILLISLAHAKEIDCSLSDGSLVFRDHMRSGGAHPFPGMLIRSVSWSYKGEKVFSEKTYYPCDEGCEVPPPEMESNISWTLNHESELTLKIEEHPYGRVKIYAVEIELSSRDYPQNMTGLTIPYLKEWFVCKEQDFLYP